MAYNVGTMNSPVLSDHTVFLAAIELAVLLFSESSVLTWSAIIQRAVLRVRRPRADVGKIQVKRTLATVKVNVRLNVFPSN